MKIVMAEKYRDAEKYLEDAGVRSKDEVWCLTNRWDTRCRTEERTEEYGEGEDGWSENDELNGQPLQDGQWQDPNPLGDTSMEELREADEEELWLRMQAFPKRRGVRGQVPREMIVVMELVKIGAVKATSVAQRYTQDIWDAIQEAWLRHCKWVESIEDRIGISQVVKEKKDKKQRI